MPRFVLLRHECPPDWVKPSHWDLMLERGQVLETWQLIDLPASWAQQLGLPITKRFRGRFSRTACRSSNRLPRLRRDT